MTTLDHAPVMKRPIWGLTRPANVLFWSTVAAVFAVRLGGMAASAMTGDLGPATGFGFTAIFPGVLIFALASLPGPQTREAMLMRLGVLTQLTLMAALPRFALHLLFGLPVVFLIIELFETRTPQGLREAIAGRIVRC